MHLQNGNHQSKFESSVYNGRKCLKISLLEVILLFTYRHNQTKQNKILNHLYRGFLCVHTCIILSEWALFFHQTKLMWSSCAFPSEQLYNKKRSAKALSYLFCLLVLYWQLQGLILLRKSMSLSQFLPYFDLIS